jgi:MepB protein
MATGKELIVVTSFHSDLLVAKTLVYDKCGFDLTNLKVDIESTEYGACSFMLNEMIIKHRISKITPTKQGSL